LYVLAALLPRYPTNAVAACNTGLKMAETANGNTLGDKPVIVAMSIVEPRSGGVKWYFPLSNWESMHDATVSAEKV
jgi:hypothetical protein